MRKYGLIAVLCFVLLVFMQGCTTPTQDNPYGISDPNTVKSWIDFGATVGAGAQGAGTATGNPYMLVYGAGLLVLAGTLRKVLFPNSKDRQDTE